MSLATAPAPTVDLCYVENSSDEDVVLKFEFKPYVIPAGQRALAPRAAINAWFGDPDLIDHPTDRRLKSRTDAARKVACRWGIFRDEQWEDGGGNSRFPTHLKVYSFEGKLLPTIHLDPYGRTLEPVDTQQADAASMLQQMDAMKKALAQLQALAAEQGVDVTEVSSDDPQPVKAAEPEPSDPEGGAVPDSSSAPKPKGRAGRNRPVTPS